jgi:hypothetical protein
MDFIHYNPKHYFEENVKSYIDHPIQSNLYDTYREHLYISEPLLIKNHNQSKHIAIPVFIPFFNYDGETPSIFIDLKNRLFLEIEYLELFYENISVSVSVENTFIISAEIPKKRKKSLFTPVIKRIHLILPNKLEIKIPAGYPSLPPDLYINEIPYINFINCCNLERIKRTIKKYFLSNCISCTTIMKPNIWKNNMTLSDILLEIDKNEKIKKIVKYDILLEELMRTWGLEYDIILNIFGFLVGDF